MVTYVFLWETKKAIATYGFETTSTVTDTVVTITGDVSDVMKVQYAEPITDEPVQFTDELRALAFPSPTRPFWERYSTAPSLLAESTTPST